MAQFQVPQFIETEPKIVGPLTLKQFGYIGVAGMLSFFLFFAVQTTIWLILTVIMGLVACAFAFLKYNGRPFEIMFINAALYIWKPKMYLWQRKDAIAQLPQVPKIPAATAPGSKMRTLWLDMITKKPAGPTAATPMPPNTTSATPSTTGPIIHPLKTGEVGGGGAQKLRELKRRKSEYGY